MDILAMVSCNGFLAPFVAIANMNNTDLYNFLDVFVCSELLVVA